MTITTLKARDFRDLCRHCFNKDRKDLRTWEPKAVAYDSSRPGHVVRLIYVCDQGHDWTCSRAVEPAEEYRLQKGK